MKLVIQRVSQAELGVNGERIAAIGRGLVVYVGIGQGDGEEAVRYLARKVANLRIFENDKGKLDYSVLDRGYEILSVSQFTLYGDCRRHGNRPDFTGAEEPLRARALYERFNEELRGFGVTVETGRFGAEMQIRQVNEGPVTILAER